MSTLSRNDFSGSKAYLRRIATHSRIFVIRDRTTLLSTMGRFFQVSPLQVLKVGPAHWLCIHEDIQGSDLKGDSCGPGPLEDEFALSNDVLSQCRRRFIHYDHVD